MTTKSSSLVSRTNFLRAVAVMAALTGCTLQDKRPGGDTTSPDAGIGSGSDPGSNTPPPDASNACVNGACPNNLFCDVDGTFGGTPDTCVAVTCSAGAIVCDGDTALTCNGSGDGYDKQACALGCTAEHGCNVCTPGATTCEANVLQVCGADGQPASTTECNAGCDASPTPHCTHVEPRYLPGVCDAPAVDASFEISGAGTVSTDDAATCTGGFIAQPNGPSICVMRFRTIKIDAGASLHATGSHVLALVGDTDVLIDGTLDVSAQGRTSGPGGGFVSSGAASQTAIGGGGAGFHTLGGNGATVTITGGAANGGAASADPVSSAVLMGGPAAGGTNGGGGGGAATVIACQGDVRVSGTLVSSGGGGAPLGGGGGAGGYIVLQGLDVHDSGNLFANGGGGGGGLGGSGADGSASLNHAAGGVGTVNSGDGGAGGAGAGPNGGPGTHPVSGTHPGGGGGGVGFFQTYTPANVTADLHPVVVSPGFQPNANISKI